MDLTDSFPEDPFLPTLAYAARGLLPIRIPWTRRMVHLGQGLDTSNNGVLIEESAFSQERLTQTALLFTECSNYTLIEDSSDSSNSSESHVNMTLAASVGGSFLGASGRGTYETHAMTNRDDLKSSVRSEFRCGSIVFRSAPALSRESVSLLRRRDEDGDKFRTTFGDYYVGGFVLGGANASLISEVISGASHSKDISVQVTGKFFGFTKTKSFADHVRGDTFDGSMTLTAFDSLTAWEETSTANDSVAQAQVKQHMTENKARSRDLPVRTAAKRRVFQLRDGDCVAWDMCHAIVASGLVAELLLLPYAGLREYVAAVLSN